MRLLLLLLLTLNSNLILAAAYAKPLSYVFADEDYVMIESKIKRAEYDDADKLIYIDRMKTAIAHVPEAKLLSPKYRQLFTSKYARYTTEPALDAIAASKSATLAAILVISGPNICSSNTVLEGAIISGDPAIVETVLKHRTTPLIDPYLFSIPKGLTDEISLAAVLTRRRKSVIDRDIFFTTQECFFSSALQFAEYLQHNTKVSEQIKRAAITDMIRSRQVSAVKPRPKVPAAHEIKA